MLRQIRARAAAPARSVRLLIPLVFGMLVIVPPQAYDQIVEASAIPPDFAIFISGTIWPSARSSAPESLHPAADLEPSLVRGLSLGLHHGARRRAGGGFPDLSAGSSGGWQPCCRAVLLIVPSVAVRGLSPCSVAELPIDACAVRRLVQSRGLCDRLPARLPARPRRRHSGTTIERQRWMALRWRLASSVLPRPAWEAGRIAPSPLRSSMAGSPMAAINGSAWSPCSALPGAGSTADSAGAPLSYRCDLSLLHRPSDRDHHDRACAARPRSAGVAAKRASSLSGTACGLRADLRDRAADRRC